MTAENPETSREMESEPKDISEAFLSMPVFEFLDHLRELKNEPALSITVDWQDKMQARRLKAFLESNKPLGQKRFAAIRATEAQMREEMNVFASGVKWIKIES